MRVYRIEGCRGEGPWSDSPHVNSVRHPDEPSPSMMPGPNTDPGLAGKRYLWANHVFGFRSLGTLIHYFHPKTRRALEANGYRLVVYEVPRAEVLQGAVQVTFPQKKARVVAKRYLSEIEVDHGLLGVL